MHDVFISYSSKDTADAERVRQILETNGISCWIAPRDIPGGSNYAREIPAAIRDCTVFLLIMSEQAQESIWVIRELDRAVNERKIVIPLMVEDVRIRDEFDFYLTGYHRYMAFEKTSEVMKTLVERIHALRSVTHPAASAPPIKPQTSAVPSAVQHSAPAPAGKQQSALRYDGFYMTQPKNNFRSYYRFYPDGAMVSSYTAATPAQAKNWLDMSKHEGGAFTVKENEIRLTEPLSGGHTYHAKISFTPNGFELSGYNSYSKKDVVKECTFLAFADISP